MSSSSGSARLASPKVSPMATIESSVTRLLVSTKHLLESLTQWARQEADDKFVSDAYVKLGNDFRAAARSFTNAGVDISDLGDVPRALRIVLELALSEAPTQENLDRFLPNIRSIIVTLLLNLKAKQTRAKEIAADQGQNQNQSQNLGSSPSGAGKNSHSRSSNPRVFSDLANSPRSSVRHLNGSVEETGRGTRTRRSKLLTELLFKANSDALGVFEGAESGTKPAEDSAQAQKGTQPESPAVLPKTRNSRTSKNLQDSQNAASSENLEVPLASSDALAKLQRNNVILRRASKRFSAYQFAKLTNLNNTHGPAPRLSAEYAAQNLPGHNSGISEEVSGGDRSFDAGLDQPQYRLSSGYLKVPGTETGTAESNSHSYSKAETPEHPYIFLRLGDKTKKASVLLPMTNASLRLLFVETFAYLPKLASFPEIYIVDLHTNISYELEEHRVDEEVKSGSLLMLKVPTYQEESLKELESTVHVLNLRIEQLASTVVLQVKDVIHSAPVPAPVVAATSMEKSDSDPKELQAHNAMLTAALKNLQAELKSVKLVLAAKDAQMKQLLADVLQEIVTLKDACLQENSPGKNRSFMEESYFKLSEDSDSLLTRVDDLQDMMEALRKDVAQRGVRLGPKQLKSTQKEIAEVKTQLDGLVEYIRDGKPSWKKIWESELDKVCEEQQFFNLQDDLTRDLDEDIRKIEETFELIEKCSVHQSKQPLKRNAFQSRMPVPEPGESLYGLRDAVLSEVCALKPDHESRLDAIARAEKIREKERQVQSLNQFQEELGDFVDENKLKSAGGIAELEKRRQQQDAENLKSSFGIV